MRFCITANLSKAAAGRKKPEASRSVNIGRPTASTEYESNWSQLSDLVCADAVFAPKIGRFIGYSSKTVHYTFTTFCYTFTDVFTDSASLEYESIADE
jgi:hypothetical protein